MVHVCQTFRTEELKLDDGLAKKALFQNAVDEVGVLFGSVEPRENFHLVDDFSIFLRLFALKLLHLLQVKQSPINYKLLSANTLVQSCVVELNDAVF